ncbi:glycoside hydrolase family 55 protein [Amniculicola lignicola CBS 123094]|uniref:Glycoside hydrolase family 55 protein n=1 Tax=Amniculicola lignicola CBS 123094 TaxID=1392246 RepID=A0A6A5VTF7_9PLEO|nr:glycoside hydrolase family 55 protein [Amniculicola lignicola CBS 123094]
MVDNQHNYFKTAPDKGKRRGPVWTYSGSLEKYMSNLRNGTVVRGGYPLSNGTTTTRFTRASNATLRVAANGYWLTKLGPLGAQPLAGNDYQFYRDVTDFGADSSGNSDATEAINAAVSSWNRDSAKGGTQRRCGKECGNTFTQGAIIYFPRGTYKICSPWYVNQNQFFRQIRNFVFDLKDMPRSTQENDQPLVPTGIHWQVSQATSLQNLVFNMPSSGGTAAANATTAVGIFTENGSGGFVSDLTFNGGNIGWRAGSQQFTARNLKFNGCLTAVQMVWDWGFNWQGIEVSGGAIAFNITGFGGDTGQGTASISLIDSSVSNVPVGILTTARDTAPNIVLDNTQFKNVDRIVQVDGGATLLSGNAGLWATGRRYSGAAGSMQTGPVTAPAKGKALLDGSGKLYVRSRPQYGAVEASGFVVATTDGGCKNDGGGDQTTCINRFLQQAQARGKIAFFPAGIYAVGGTVFIPTGSKLQGASWSQIQGGGFYFGDMQAPKVMVQVGNKGDVGSLEIVDMLFSVKGATAGAILMEWNVAAAENGAAGMWDSHFRVGGAKGSDLDLDHCPKFSQNDGCIAASLMFHVTPQASGYFENVWAWLADHDNDASVFDQPDSTITQVSIFGARGMLVESQGPSWFYGSGSEHSVLYNYLLSGAKDVYMGHIQTESPYFQPVPAAPAPFAPQKRFPNDPDFSKCNVTANSDSEQCRYAWGLRIVDSTDVTIHGAGLYSFFNAYYQDCIDTHSCQERILEVTGSTGVVIFNLFTVATVQIANGIDGSKVLQADSNQRGFTTEVSVWVPLPGKDHANVVYVGPDIFSSPSVSCSAPCVLVFPTSRLDSPTTITPSPYVTSLEYGTFGITSVNGAPATVFVTSTTTITITIPPITVPGMPFSNFNITSSGPTSIIMYPSVDIPPVTLPVPNGQGGTTPRVVSLPPWPLVNQGPGGTGVNTDPGTESGTNTGSLTGSTTYYTGITSTITASGATITTVRFPPSLVPFTVTCPDETVTTRCTDSSTHILNFACPTTKVISFLGSTTALVSDASSTTNLPMYATWPNFGIIEPVTTTPSAPEPTDDGVTLPCTAWFFFICISWGQIHVGGWHLRLPPGIYPPGPPPPSLIKWPPGFTLSGILPPWPKFTIGNDHRITTDKEPECQTKTAEACTYSTIFSVTTTTKGITTTTGTSTSSHCETIKGCSVSGSDQTTTSTDVQIGTQTIAPVGTWVDEAWFADDGAAFSSSVFAELYAALEAAEASEGGSTISFTPGPSASPTCASGTGCGGHLCSGYWCDATPTSAPPGFHDPKDPSSDGFSASKTMIGGTTTTPSATPTNKPKTPLSRGPINCFSESGFPGHADIQSGDQDGFSTAFSNLRSQMGDDDSLGPNSPTVRLRKTDKHGVNYDYSCGWVPGCETTVAKQSFGFPLGSPSLITAYLMVREDYTKCK